MAHFVRYIVAQLVGMSSIKSTVDSVGRLGRMVARRPVDVLHPLPVRSARLIPTPRCRRLGRGGGHVYPANTY